MSAIPNQQALLFSEANRVFATVRNIMLREFQREISRHDLSDSDLLRLLTLKIWSEKYKVGIEFILRVLLPYYWKVVPRKRRTDRGFGIKICVFTGQAAQLRLEDEIVRAFPANEHMDAWRSAMRAKQVGRRSTPPVSDPISDPSFMSDYGRYISKVRTRRQVTSSSRAYRDNPWK